MNSIQKFKNYLYKTKEWLKLIFIYREIKIDSNKDVDYDIYWKKKREGGNMGSLGSWQKMRADLAVKIISGFPRPSINDMGSGAGEVLKYITDRINNSKGRAYDISGYALSVAKGFGFETINFDIRKKEDWAKITESDFTLMFEVLEHVPESESFLKVAFDKSKKGVLFSFPNTGFVIHRLRIMFGKFPLQWVNHPGEHLRFWTLSDLKWWLKALGYKNYKIIPYAGVPFLNKIWPSMFAAGIFVFLKK